MVDARALPLYNTYIDSKERTMQYTVITSNGRIHVLSIKELAETYVKAYGGVVITQQILVDDTAESLYN